MTKKAPAVASVKSPAVTPPAAAAPVPEPTSVSFAKKTNGGYPVGLFTNRPSDHLMCMVCTEVLRDPLQCSNGHSGCYHCLTEYHKTSSECPLRCGATIVDVSKLVINRIALNFVDDQEARCPTIVFRHDQSAGAKKAELCPWVGKLAAASKHIDACEYALVQCPHADCSVVKVRPALERHAAECEHRLLPCAYCDRHVKAKGMPEHTSACNMRPVPCPNGCTTATPSGSAGGEGQPKPSDVPIQGSHAEKEAAERREITLCPFQNLSAHLNVCPEALVACGYANLGCAATVRRKDLTAHMQDMAGHWSCMMSSLALQKKEYKDLREAHNRLEQSFEKFHATHLDRMAALLLGKVVWEGTFSDSNQSQSFEFADRKVIVLYEKTSGNVKLEYLKSDQSPLTVVIEGSVTLNRYHYGDTSKEIHIVVVLGAPGSSLIADFSAELCARYPSNSRYDTTIFRLTAKVA